MPLLSLNTFNGNFFNSLLFGMVKILNPNEVRFIVGTLMGISSG